MFSFSLTAASESLQVVLVDPDGRRAVIGAIAPSGVESGAVPIESPGPGSATTYLAVITNPVPGIWSMDVSELVPSAATIDIDVRCVFHNTVRLALATARDATPAEVPVRVALALFDGATRNRALSIRAHLLLPDDPTFSPVDVMFADDGKGVDESADDGIYEASVNLDRAGVFHIDLDVDGVASTGLFHRSSATSIRAVARTADVITFTDRGIDIDHDGLLDQLVVSPLAAIVEGGDYLVTVRLRGSNGREIERSLETHLTAGIGSADVSFDTADILSDVGIDGPYHVAEIAFLRSTGGDLVPADVRADVGDTATYQLITFERAPVRLVKAGPAIGVDAGDGGFIGRRDVTVELATETAGEYSFSASVTDTAGTQLGFVAGSEFLEAGTSAITIRIPDEEMGGRGVNGPLCLSNLVLFGAGTTLVVGQALVAGPSQACEPSNHRVFSPAAEALFASPTRGSGNGRQLP